jgi:hypothetical protein
MLLSMRPLLVVLWRWHFCVLSPQSLSLRKPNLTLCILQEHHNSPFFGSRICLNLSSRTFGRSLPDPPHVGQFQTDR